MWQSGGFDGSVKIEGDVGETSQSSVMDCYG